MTNEHTESCRSHRKHRRSSRDHRARKERVLHTRISDELAADIRQFADDLRVPASNLVRNVLEEVFSVVDSVSDDVGDLFDDLIEEAEGVRSRVRDQADSRSRRGSRRNRARRRGQRSDDSDVEAEMRRDEAAETVAGAPPSGSATEKTDSTTADDRGGATASGPPRPRAAELFPDVLGWQPLVLNRDFECGRCARPLSAGDSAFLGLREQGLTQIALCGRCAGSR